MAHSVCAVYVDDNGQNMNAVRVSWDNFMSLQSSKLVVGLFVFWDQAGVVNRNEISGHECYSMRRAPGADAAIEITQCDAAGGPGGSQEAADRNYHDDGVRFKTRQWPGKLFSAAMAGPVRLLAYDWNAPNFASLLAAARTLADATPVT